MSPIADSVLICKPVLLSWIRRLRPQTLSALPHLRPFLAHCAQGSS